MDIRTAVSQVFGGGRSTRPTESELQAMIGKAAGEQERAEREVEAAQRALDELLTDRDLGNPVAERELGKARERLDTANGRARALRVTADRATRQRADMIAAALKAEREVWIADIRQGGTSIAALIAEAGAAADALGAAMLRLGTHLGATLQDARRGRGVVDVTGLQAFVVGLHRAVLDRLALRTGGVFPTTGPTEVWSIAQRPTLAAQWAAVAKDVEAAAAAYTGVLQPKARPEAAVPRAAETKAA